MMFVQPYAFKNTAELYIWKWWILWHVNCISKKKKKRQAYYYGVLKTIVLITWIHFNSLAVSLNACRTLRVFTKQVDLGALKARSDTEALLWSFYHEHIGIVKCCMFLSGRGSRVPRICVIVSWVLRARTETAICRYQLKLKAWGPGASSRSSSF